MYLSSVNLLNQTVCIIIARQIILSLSDAMVICVCLIECALTSFVNAFICMYFWSLSTFYQLMHYWSSIQCANSYITGPVYNVLGYRSLYCLYTGD